MYVEPTGTDRLSRLCKPAGPRRPISYSGNRFKSAMLVRSSWQHAGSLVMATCHHNAPTIRCGERDHEDLHQAAATGEVHDRASSELRGPLSAALRRRPCLKKNGALNTQEGVGGECAELPSENHSLPAHPSHGSPRFEDDTLLPGRPNHNRAGAKFSDRMHPNYHRRRPARLPI